MGTVFASQGDRCGWPQAILFDLDGTLVDSVPDLRTAVNAALAAEGHAPLSDADVRLMVGLGAAKLVERAFAARAVPLSADALALRTARMLDAYADCLTENTKALPGALEMVAAYHRARVKIAVVTNKPQAPARTILSRLGFADHVDAVIGGDTGPARKPAPDMLLHAVQGFGLHPSRALMVGDTAHDVEAARAAGMAVLVVEGGYTARPAAQLGADSVLASLSALPQAIERLKQPA
ncbi:MAG: HAD-IA family hydrolase [Notoacmeibacter sp.]|nr:HAD-IA family hydrolase [Notoacmeibacter sp.]MCC0033254.1 HAD-IA family hydrolase [Brucellaceae bacterium]